MWQNNGSYFCGWFFIVDHYCFSFCCRPLLFILLLSTIIVYPFIVNHYCLSFYYRPLLFILLLSAIIIYPFIFYCFIEKLHSSCIFISGGHVVVVSADFDFTLLYKLIRNLLTAIPPPTFGWGKEPLPEHLNETDDIERIRSFRNGLSHNTKLQICDADFSTHWTDLSQVK